jgi:CrcB protein
MVVTGFLGGLSTFSTFASEIVILLARREYWWGLAHASVHVIGSVTTAALGMLMVRFLFSAEV